MGCPFFVYFQLWHSTVVRFFRRSTPLIGALSNNDTVKYEEASRELQTIIDQLQEESVPIDELGEKTKRAAELIRFCRQKLRTTQQDLDQLFAEGEEET